MLKFILLVYNVFKNTLLFKISFYEEIEAGKWAKCKNVFNISRLSDWD